MENLREKRNKDDQRCLPSLKFCDSCSSLLRKQNLTFKRDLISFENPGNLDFFKLALVTKLDPLYESRKCLPSVWGNEYYIK